MSNAVAAPSASVALSRMSGFQWRAIGICVLLNMLDGFDVMVMAFTAPHVTVFHTVDVTSTLDLVSSLRDDRSLAGHRIGPRSPCCIET